MKAFTDIEQSRKLAKILPIESADCYWDYDEMQKFHRISWFEDGYNKESQLMLNENNVCAWSLAALLDVYPMVVGRDMGMYCCWQNNKNLHSRHYDKPVDACYEMILKLNEQKLI